MTADPDLRDRQEVAEAMVSRMYAADLAAQAMGIRYIAVAPGTATVTLTVTDAMVNGHGMCHGGIVFTLADTAFAFACNSHGPAAVAHTCEITFARAARPGDELVATAVERTSYGRNGIYDVTVTCGDEVVAEFRGHSRQIGKGA